MGTGEVRLSAWVLRLAQVLVVVLAGKGQMLGWRHSCESVRGHSARRTLVLFCIAVRVIALRQWSVQLGAASSGEREYTGVVLRAWS